MLLLIMTRARDLDLEFEGRTGIRNTICDVSGVEVGHSTLIGKASGDRKVRTGVTAILPRGKKTVNSHIFAGSSTLNGNGEVTGLSWIGESGILSGPVMLTNTYSVGLVRDSVIKYMSRRGLKSDVLPVVGEISDEYLNDISGHHVQESHVIEAIESSRGDNVLEGNVGGGTGAVCYEFKGGIGTSSRIVEAIDTRYRVGALVQANHGLRRHLTILGEPIGKELTENLVRTKEYGSIVIVLATDAPLLPHQLNRLARRAYLGLAHTGSVSSNGSGDFCIAFTTAQEFSNSPADMQRSNWIPNGGMDHIFEGTVAAVEEAVINALVAAETMSGNNDHKVYQIPYKALKKIAKNKR